MGTGLCSLSEFPAENKAVLRLHVEAISLNRIEEFREQCLALLKTGLGMLIVDLSPLTRIPSGVLAAVMDAGLLAQASNDPPQQVVVLAGPAVARQLRLFEHSNALDIRQWDSEETPPAEIKLDTDGSALAGC